MRFQFQTFDQFSSGSKNRGISILLVSAAEIKKGKWTTGLPGFLKERVTNVAERHKGALTAGERFCVRALDKNEEDAWIAVLPEKRDTYVLLEFARDTLKDAVATDVKAVNLYFADTDLEAALADAFGSALAARVFLMPVYGERAKKQKPFQLKDVKLAASAREALTSFERGYALGNGTNLARELATLPPNVLDPAEYGRRVRELAKKHRLGARFYSNRELKRMGAGAFTAVDRGNPASKGGIYELTYAPRGARNKKAINLVGKGMCYDTGGYDVKTGGNMYTMKGDMQGSAIALATLVAAAELKLPLKMKAFLAVTENHLSPVAYKADEVVTALNGISIEVVNTDAEGRMVLADTLTLASKESPECVIDFATLTGSAVRALGTRIAAGFTNRKELHAPIVDAGDASGERVWTFPIDDTYFKALKSHIADTLQCTKGPGADHIFAACFLSKFLKEGTPWVHIDLTPAENEGGIGHVDSLFTGFGVRWAHEFLKRYL